MAASRITCSRRPSANLNLFKYNHTLRQLESHKDNLIEDCMGLFYILDDMYGHYVSSGYSYHPPVAPVLSVADMIPPPPPPPGEGPFEGMVCYHHSCVGV